jgi:SNF family Na+-dependent transporter
MFMTGITQVYAFVLGFITNLTDYFETKPWKAAIPVTIFGLGLSVAFTSNSGWVLFDLAEHYILRYIVIMVGFLQCVSVGWYFEYFTTAAVSKVHNNSLRILALFYWIPMIVITFYANFGLESNKMYGLLLVCPFTLLALIISYCMARSMGFNSWYHEIVLQGVDKLSMSITSLSN